MHTKSKIGQRAIGDLEHTVNKKVVNASKTGPPIMAKNREMAKFVRFEGRSMKLLFACDMTRTRRCLPMLDVNKTRVAAAHELLHHNIHLYFAWPAFCMTVTEAEPLKLSVAEWTGTAELESLCAHAHPCPCPCPCRAPLVV